MIPHKIGSRFFLLLAIVFASYLFALPAHATDEFLKFHWAFVEGSGTTAADSSGNTTTYPGTLYQGPTWIPEGGLTFDGINDYVRTDSAIPNSMGVTDQAYTLSASVRVPEAGENGNIIHISNGSGGVGWCIAMLHIESGHFRAIGWNSGSVVASDPTEATPGQWYSIANTWSPDTQEMDLYVNGSLVASSSMAHFTAANENVYIFAGLDPGGCDNNHGWFKGDIKDVRIYSRAISQTEAQQNSDASIALPAESFSPADDTTNVAPDTNLTITFGTSTVATSTGSIGLYKTSDDSLVESFAINSSRILKNTTLASTTFTIDPSTTLAESTEYYVSIPGIAFQDASNTFYPGTTASTTWNFTTGDFTTPTIFDIATSSLTTTGATITWSTSENASTQLWYSADTTYASSTEETDTGTRVISHEATLSDLIVCTLYNYKVVSRDTAGNTATSTSAIFTTTGCAGDATPSSATSTSITVSGTGMTELSDSDHTLTIDTPANFTATSSSVIIQIKALSAATVLDSIITPADNLRSAASVVFEVTALIDNTTILDSFDAPVTVTYHYTDADIAGLDESTLMMYHYHSGAWLPLDSCTVNVATNTITCTTREFSLFALFATTAAPQSSSSSSSHSSSGTSMQARVANLLAIGNRDMALTLMQEWPDLFPHQSLMQASSHVPTYRARDLSVGLTGEDVRMLQQLLNTNGFKVASTGPGSEGHETSIFGARTRNALARYQKAKGITPAIGYFGPITRTSMKTTGLLKVWW